MLGGVLRPSCPAAAGRRVLGPLRIRPGAIMWIAGQVLFLMAQLAAQSAWRISYNWMANPLSDLGAVHCQ
jgi:hypothetical protein